MRGQFGLKPYQLLTDDFICQKSSPNVFSRIGFHETLVSDNAQRFSIPDFMKWCLFPGMRNMVSPAYHPHSKGLNQKGVQISNKGMRTWKVSLCVSFGAYLQRVIMTGQNTSPNC